MERRGQHRPLPHRNRVIGGSGQHLHIRTDPLHPRGADEDRMHRTVEPVERNIAFERIDLSPKRVAPHGDIDARQRQGLAAGSSRIKDLAGQQDHSRACAIGRQPVGQAGAQRLQQAEFAQQMAHRGGLPTGNHQPVDGVEFVAAPDADRVGSRITQRRQVLADAMADYDVILTPSAPGTAPHGLGATGNPMFNRLWTLMGSPCVNVPGLSDNGLPLGVQIVGRFGRDRAALEAALFVEQAIARKTGA